MTSLRKLPAPRWAGPGREGKAQPDNPHLHPGDRRLLGGQQPAAGTAGVEDKRAARPLVAAGRTCAGSGHSEPGGPAGLTASPRSPPGARWRESNPS
ncbi:unnamed protein product [Merluccius merluccius]